nr:SprT family zinc-dependent metalloprotease [Bartonella australis]
MAIYERDFVLSGCVVPFHVREHKYARRFTLRIDARGQRICLTTPPAVDPCAVQSFIDRHRSWIEERFACVFSSFKNFSLEEGAAIPFLGVAHIITRKEGRGIAQIVAGDTKKEPQIIIYSRSEYLPRRVADVLKKQAEMIMTPLAAHYASKVECKVKSIRYKDTKSLWGSCSADGRLSFSWRLVMAPKEIIEYVIAHEISHLIEMNHGPKFWALCEKLCPSSKTYQAWLKKNGHMLQAINFH